MGYVGTFVEVVANGGGGGCGACVIGCAGNGASFPLFRIHIPTI